MLISLLVCGVFYWWNFKLLLQEAADVKKSLSSNARSNVGASVLSEMQACANGWLLFMQLQQGRLRILLPPAEQAKQ